jgi:hypothetical protein
MEASDKLRGRTWAGDTPRSQSRTGERRGTCIGVRGRAPHVFDVCTCDRWMMVDASLLIMT